MDFKGQKSGGTNSNGTNSVPASDFSVAQNTQQASHTANQNHSQFQPSSAVNEQPFQAQNSASATSNTHNDSTNVAFSTSVNAPAEDSDLIEKEWVLKAKAIVENTQNNPFIQSQKLAELRTEYLQKRYGKSLQEDA